MSRKRDQVAKFLDLGNRVEVLSECIHDDVGSLDMNQLNGLMEKYYPSLENFFRDVKSEEKVISIRAFLGMDKVIFTAQFDDKTSKTFTYTDLDEFV